MVLQSYQRETEEQDAKNKEERYEEKAQEIETSISGVKAKIKKMFEVRTSIQNTIETSIKPDFIATESRIRTLENIKDNKLEVRFACS